MSIMEENGEATPRPDDIEEMTPEESAMLGRIATSPSFEGMSDIEYAKFLTKFFKDMDEESEWLHSSPA